MKLHLFERRGLFFIPIHIVGWMLALSASVWCVVRFIDIDSRSHSVSDTLMNCIFNALIAAAVYACIAFFTCRPERTQ